MCSPRIVHSSHDDSAAWIGRRALFGAAGLGALAMAAPARAAPNATGAVVDLTHTLTPQLPVWPGNPPFAMVPVKLHADTGFGQQELAFWEHTGTHLDAPAHRVAGGSTTESIPAADLVAPLVVVDISAKAAADADAVVTIADLEAWQSEHGRIPARAFVAMYSGWERRLDDSAAFLNLDADGQPHAPGFDHTAAEYLVTQCDIVGAGVDTLSLDRACDLEFGAHSAILGTGRYGVEMLANLASLPPVGASVVVGAPKHAGGTGGPCRVLAFT